MVDMVVPELAQAQYQDRIRDAQKIRPHATMPKSSPSFIRSLVRFLARSHS
jgi:hypothetical protein